MKGRNRSLRLAQKFTDSISSAVGAFHGQFHTLCQVLEERLVLSDGKLRVADLAPKRNRYLRDFHRLTPTDFLPAITSPKAAHG
ncbi:MAG: hypothetical protein GTN74_09150 [Proteobacteria bacterium]|nr:hypothetical protein [Pseudomonadota bacterium]